MDTKSHKTVWNRHRIQRERKNEKKKLFALARQTNEWTKMKCYYNSGAVLPFATAFHITFNYYCINERQGFFPDLSSSPFILFARARVCTKNQTSNQMNTNRKKKEKKTTMKNERGGGEQWVSEWNLVSRDANVSNIGVVSLYHFVANPNIGGWFVSLVTRIIRL